MWGAIIGAGLSLVAQNKQKKATDAANAGNLAQNALAQQAINQGEADAIGAQKKGLTLADKSYQDALGAASTVGTASKSQILRRERQYQGAATASALNRGLGASSAAQNGLRGVYESTNQALAGIDEQVAGLMAQIHQGRGRTALQGYSQIANIYQQSASARAGLHTQIQHQAADVGGGYAQAAYGIGKLISMYEGGYFSSEPDAYKQDVAQNAAGQAGLYGAQIAYNLL